MISSHILDELGKLADSYGIIHEGRLLDEFTLDELSNRCGQYVIAKTSDNDKAVSIIRQLGFNSIGVDPTGNIRIDNAIERSEEITKSLVLGGVGVKEIFIKKTTLEEYYLSVTGGNHNG